MSKLADRQLFPGVFEGCLDLPDEAFQELTRAALSLEAHAKTQEPPEIKTDYRLRRLMFFSALQEAGQSLLLWQEAITKKVNTLLPASAPYLLLPHDLLVEEATDEHCIHFSGEEGGQKMHVDCIGRALCNAAGHGALLTMFISVCDGHQIRIGGVLSDETVSAMTCDAHSASDAVALVTREVLEAEARAPSFKTKIVPAGSFVIALAHSFIHGGVGTQGYVCQLTKSAVRLVLLLQLIPAFLYNTLKPHQEMTLTQPIGLFQAFEPAALLNWRRYKISKDFVACVLCPSRERDVEEERFRVGDRVALLHQQTESVLVLLLKQEGGKRQPWAERVACFADFANKKAASPCHVRKIGNSQMMSRGIEIPEELQREAMQCVRQHFVTEGKRVHAKDFVSIFQFIASRRKQVEEDITKKDKKRKAMADLQQRLEASEAQRKQQEVQMELMRKQLEEQMRKQNERMQEFMRKQEEAFVQQATKMREQHERLLAESLQGGEAEKLAKTRKELTACATDVRRLEDLVSTLQQRQEAKFQDFAELLRR